MLIADLNYVEDIHPSEQISGGALVNLNINVTNQFAIPVAVGVGVFSGPVQVAADALNKIKGRQRIRV